MSACSGYDLCHPR